MGWILHENGNYYQTSDDAGTLENVIYSEGRSDDPAALHTQLPTGRMVEDKSKTVGTVYTIGKYDGDITGARLSALGRKRRREAINTLLSKRTVNKAEELFYNEYGLGEFANLFRKDGNLRRRAFRNQDFLNTIASREYSTNDVYRPRTNATLGKAADVISKNINAIVNPVLTKKVDDGHFETGWYKKSVPYLDWEEKKFSGGCHTENCKLRSIKVLKLKHREENRYGRHWEKASYNNINAFRQSKDIYGQKPEMADFHALPAKLQTTTSTENRTLQQSTPATTTSSTTLTSTPGSSGTVTLRSGSGSGSGSGRTSGTSTRTIKSTSPGTVTKKTAVTTSPSSATSTNQTREITTTRLPDGTVVNTSYGDWMDVK